MDTVGHSWRLRVIGGFRVAGSIALVLACLGVPGVASGQWIEPPGRGWIDLTFYHQDTEHQFGRDREREQIPNGGHAVTTSLFLTGVVGLIRGWDAWIQVPVHWLRYDDFGGERDTFGFGDPRVFLRAGPEFLGLPAIPVAVRGGVKWPGGNFDIDAEVIPLGEGQRDVELLVEVGRSFHPRPIWAMGWVGYRWRGANRPAERDPGNERFWYAAVGGELGRVGWKGALEGLSGDPWRLHGILISSTPREILETSLSVDWPIGPGRLGAGARTPVRGRNVPAGTVLSLHYFFRWGATK